MRGNTRWTIHNMKKFWKSFKINFILHSKCVKHSDNWVYEQWFQIFFEDVFQDAQNRRNVFEVEVSKFLQVGEPHPLPPLQKKQHKIRVQLTCNEWQVKKRVVLGRHGDFYLRGKPIFFFNNKSRCCFIKSNWFLHFNKCFTLQNEFFFF